MVYLSQLLNKNIYYKNQKIGSIADFAVFTNVAHPSLSKVVIKKGKGKKITVTPSAIDLKRKKAILISDNIPFLPYDEKDFYLNEDLLDKQVIDTDGKRLVRVNDVMLDDKDELKVVGIDIGAAGILRRLGLEAFIKSESKILPWKMIEAFDYNTGNVRINVAKDNLNSFHPSEMADILEELGTKERLGIVETLEAKLAARSIEETDDRTQEAILGELPSTKLSKIVNRMHIAEIADLFYLLNPLRINEILKAIGTEKAGTIKNLIQFSNNTAGGLMNPRFFSFDSETTIKEVYNILYERRPKPETILVTNGNQKLLGVLLTKDILDLDPLAQLKDLVTNRKFVYVNVELREIIRLFSEYNLRSLPVVDQDKKPIGIITIDMILAQIESSNRDNEII